MKTTAQINHSGLKNRSEQLSMAPSSTDQAAAANERKDFRLPIDREQREANRSLPTPKLLHLLISQFPDVYRLAEVVGKWVWVQFSQSPAAEIRQELAQLGFHWNRARQWWQHLRLEFRWSGALGPSQDIPQLFSRRPEARLKGETPMNTNKNDSPFGKVIYSFTCTQALSDAVQVEVSSLVPFVAIRPTSTN